MNLVCLDARLTILCFPQNSLFYVSYVMHRIRHDDHTCYQIKKSRSVSYTLMILCVQSFQLNSDKNEQNKANTPNNGNGTGEQHITYSFHVS